MTTVVRGDHPEITEWLDRRRALGQDKFDEVWDGSSYVAPNVRHEHGVAAVQIMIALEPDAEREDLISSGPFNLGDDKNDFRVPDGAWTRGKHDGIYVPTAEAVLEVLSPGDQTYHKLGFYFRHAVREVLVAHPTERWVHCYSAPDAGRLNTSLVLGRSMTSLSRLVRWP